MPKHVEECDSSLVPLKKIKILEEQNKWLKQENKERMLGMNSKNIFLN